MNCNRPILKRKLDQMYYPDCSVETVRRKFRAEIQKMPGLAKALSKAGYNPNDKKWFFSPLQIRIITRYLQQP